MGCRGKAARSALTLRSPPARINGVPASSQSTPASTAMRAVASASSRSVRSSEIWTTGGGMGRGYSGAPAPRAAMRARARHSSIRGRNRRAPGVQYTIHMKRTNLVLDERILEEATRLSGERTYSRTVERALEDFIKRVKARQILDL